MCVSYQDLFQFTLKCSAEGLGMGLGIVRDIIRDLILIES